MISTETSYISFTHNFKHNFEMLYLTMLPIKDAKHKFVYEQ